MLAAAVATPLVAALLIAVSGRRPNLRETWTLLAATLTLAATIVLFVGLVANGSAPTLDLVELAPGLELRLRVDDVGMLLAVSASALWLATSAYAIGYVRGSGEVNQTRFYTAFALCVAATMALAFSANFFTFFIFYELLTAATWPLVVHKQTPEALAAGRRYLRYLLGGGTALLLALVITQVVAPGRDFVFGGYLDGMIGNAGVIVIVVLVTLGFGTKAAMMAMHRWLPSAMVAPTPVSSLLHAVAVVKAGVFGFVRVFGFVIGPDLLAEVGAGVVVAAIAATTIVVASVIAFRQDNLKRRLAYSTIGHLSFIILGVSLLSAESWNGALLYIANHAVLKITLFFCAGAIYVTEHKTHISELDGIGRRMPLTMAAFAVASLGLAGVPPVGGWVSKWFLGMGTASVDQPVLAFIVLGSGLLTAGYLMPVVYRAFFRPTPPSPTDGLLPVRAVSGASLRLAGEAKPMMLVPLVATATISLLLGLGDVFRLDVLTSAVSSLVVGVGP
jgi:multicomponent Na+:H+ antiporter subunit D